MDPGWQQARIAFVKKLMPVGFFKDKTVLELGACDGYIGNAFAEMGSNITCVEGKASYVRLIRSKFPHLNVIQADCDTSTWEFGKFDVIINFGILYHLENHHEAFLTNCINNCSIMFLESVILDSNQNDMYYRNERGIGQGLSGVAGTPSTSFVEDIFRKTNTTFTKHSTTELNRGPHNYTWADANAGFNPFFRRFWLVNGKMTP